MALGRNNGNQAGREGVFADVRNVGGYGAKTTAQLVLCPNDRQPSVLLMTLEYGQRQNRKGVRRNIVQMRCRHREICDNTASFYYQ